MERFDVMSAIKPEHLEEALRRGYVAAYRFLGTPEESRDACQEAVRKALAAGERYDSQRPFYPWFYRILKNHCLDRLAARRRDAEQQDQLRHVPVQASAPNAEEHALRGEREQSVSRALPALDPDLREIVELRHFQDLSYEEMADILECPVGTVMSRLYRARKQLREILLRDPAFSEGSDSMGRMS